MIAQNKIIILMFAFLLVSSFASATELKLVKVSELKVGDVIVSNAGVEIPVTDLVPVKSDKVTISGYLMQKVFREEETNNIKVVASGNSGQGVISGNAIINVPVVEKVDLNNFQKIVNTLRGWFGQ